MTPDTGALDCPGTCYVIFIPARASCSDVLIVRRAFTQRSRKPRILSRFAIISLFVISNHGINKLTVCKQATLTLDTGCLDMSHGELTIAIEHYASLWSDDTLDSQTQCGL